MKKTIILIVVIMTTCSLFADEERELRFTVSGKMPTNNEKLFMTSNFIIFNMVKSMNGVLALGVAYAPAKYFDIGVSVGFHTLKKVCELSTFPKFTFGKFIWRSRLTIKTDNEFQFESFALYLLTKDFSVGIETDRFSLGTDEEKIRTFGPHASLTFSKNFNVAVTTFFTHRGPVTRGYVTISL